MLTQFLCVHLSQWSHASDIWFALQALEQTVQGNLGLLGPGLGSMPPISSMIIRWVRTWEGSDVRSSFDLAIFPRCRCQTRMLAAVEGRGGWSWFVVANADNGDMSKEEKWVKSTFSRSKISWKISSKNHSTFWMKLTGDLLTEAAMLESVRSPCSKLRSIRDAKVHDRALPVDEQVWIFA